MKELGHVFKRCGRFSLLESLLGTQTGGYIFVRAGKRAQGAKVLTTNLMA